MSLHRKALRRRAALRSPDAGVLLSASTLAAGRGSAGHTDGAQADARRCAGGEAGGKPERPKPARDARRERK